MSMRAVEIVEAPDAASLARLTAVTRELEAAIGTPPFSDHLRLDLRAGGAPGFRAVVVSESGPHGHRPLSMAQASAANASLAVEVAARPGAGQDVWIDAADTLLDSIARTGGGAVTWWVDDADDSVVELAVSHGLSAERRLHEMRRPLPHPDRAPIATRAFEPGRDDDTWLAVNNRAFAGHGEQGGWTRDTLATRLAEPWFDPDGFRLYEDGGRLVGFCWTKVHTDEIPPLGEIYAIAIDPDAHGKGLGRALTLAGLDSLAARGITRAGLYVDADNAPAVAVYHRLGFELHRTRVAFSGRLGPP